MLASLNAQQISFLIILVVAFGLLLTERIRSDIVALLIILSLYVTRVLEPEEALSGFSSEPAIIVAAIFVLSGALHQTGLSDTIGAWLGRWAGASYTRALAVIMGGVALLSAFTHHLTTTAVMLPVTLNLSRERDIPASKLLMPLSFAASLGTTITIIGAPAFLIASDVLRQAGRPGLGIFSIAPIGLAISFLGILFMLVAGRFLLPSRTGMADAGERFRLGEYFTELTILPDSPYLGMRLDEVKADPRYQFDVAGWIRDGRHLLGGDATPPTGIDDGPEVATNGDRLRAGVAVARQRLATAVDRVREGRQLPERLATVVDRVRESQPQLQAAGELRLEEGDVLLIRTAPEELVTIRQEPGVELNPVAKYGDVVAASAGEEEEIGDRLVQAVVAPASDLVRRTIGDIDFRRRYGAIVVGLWRREGWLQQELSKTRLRAGDVLVLQGDEEALDRVANDRAFLMLVPFEGEVRLRRRASLAGIIMLGTIVAAAFNLMTIEMAAVAGAVAMVLTRCLTRRQAYRAIDARIYVFIAGAIPLGVAMQKTGTSELIAGWLQRAVGGWNQIMILLALFAVVAILTQFMSDAGTTAIFAPVAAALAGALGHAPEPYVVTVAMAAVASFLTPIGHHGNLLVYSPGRYQFADFVKVGTPLTVVVALIVAVMAPLLWPA